MPSPLHVYAPRYAYAAPILRYAITAIDTERYWRLPIIIRCLPLLLFYFDAAAPHALLFDVASLLCFFADAALRVIASAIRRATLPLLY